jgi:hypothetical protein
MQDRMEKDVSGRTQRIIGEKAEKRDLFPHAGIAVPAFYPSSGIESNTVK